MTTSNIEVAVHSPVSSPGVADVPGLNAILSGEASELDAVINLLAAVLDHTVAVRRPGRGINADGERANALEVAEHQVLIIALGDVFPASDLGTNGVAVELASAIAGSVGVRDGSVQTSSTLDVVESVFSPATIATIGGLIAINNLLRGQNGQRAMSNMVIRLDGLSGRESPARSALFLVLNSADSALVTPIEGGGGINLRNIDGTSRAGDVGTEGLGHQVVGGKFLRGQIREFGNTIDGTASFLGLELSSALHVLHEDTKAIGILEIAVSAVIGGNEGVERLHIVLEGSSAHSGNEQDGDQNSFHFL